MSTTILTEPEPQQELPPQGPAGTATLGLAPAGTAIFHLAPAPGALDIAPSVREIFVVPVPLVPVREEVPARQRQAVSARRRARLDWEAIAVILLMLACAAVGLYRLIWMGNI